ncbi:hypothetical protein ES319_D05G417400v1 [Gossypium barbadense]|uniref:Uncharacterized protein n=1 Tax=Gossypium barbadense TaxID=3634 RepID=A0A5J5RPQ8_GOSBA|nr:hypothetical protein ES319_D05G417300v1 [Gossypium barbadense]KAB2032995.1 hypothetical protein ES319_D05G417400v1 [Gossypium barbadense]KAB2032996.1 hypothetical protein ES319_D05G417400v1 [Gossypium barbadense]
MPSETKAQPNPEQKWTIMTSMKRCFTTHTTSRAHQSPRRNLPKNSINVLDVLTHINVLVLHRTRKTMQNESIATPNRVLSRTF